MFKVWTVEELAEDAFLKAERVKALEGVNRPLATYDERKAAFVELAVAQAAATEARQRLLAVTNGERP